MVQRRKDSEKPLAYEWDGSINWVYLISLISLIIFQYNHYNKWYNCFRNSDLHHQAGLNFGLAGHDVIVQILRSRQSWKIHPNL